MSSINRDCPACGGKENYGNNHQCIKVLKNRIDDLEYKQERLEAMLDALLMAAERGVVR